MLQFASIASGSNGNCYYIGNKDEAILVDAGISCRETERRMTRMGLAIEKVKAVFISHEHSDHISGLKVFSRKYQLPVYISAGTLRNSQLELPVERVKNLIPDSLITVGNINIRSFIKSHDAADPHSFVISQNGFHVGVFTDIGYACTEIIKYLPVCHAVFLESNYCENMLADSHYPISLKKRISGKKGHLSNTEASELIALHAGSQLGHLVLSHLSANNNHPEKVKTIFAAYQERFHIHVASRHEESPIWEIDTKANPTKLPTANGSQQMALFP